MREASHDTTTEESPRVAVTLRGADGTSAGVTASLANDGRESPMLLVAITVKEYEVPFVRPVTTHEFGSPAPAVHVALLPLVVTV